MNFNKVLILSGATATGKTATAIKIACLFRSHRIKIEIINFDSLLFYKELSIGTAKPVEKDLREVPHHLINTHSIGERSTISSFIVQAEDMIKKLFKEKTIPLLVGGSPFYLRGFMKGIYGENRSNRREETLLYDIKDRTLSMKEKEDLYLELRRVDPLSASHIHRNDLYRLSRALQFYHSNGYGISVERALFEKRSPYDFSQHRFSNWTFEHIYLALPKEEHLRIIEERTRRMIDDGLIQEIENLLNCGFTGREQAFSSIGYKEGLEYLSRKSYSLKELHEKICIATRQLAKSQKTFFNKISPKRTFHAEREFKKLYSHIEAILLE